MSFEIIDSDIERTFIIQGDLLSSHIRVTEEQINNEILKDNKDITVDLINVNKIDSMSIAAVIRLKNKLTEKGRSLKLINPNESVMRVLELAGLDEFLLD